MKLGGSGKAVNILVTDDDRWEGKPLYEEIVRKAHEAGLAGASVFRGFLSFGGAGPYHDSNIEVLMGNLPMSVLIIDTEEKINQFIPELDGMIEQGLVQTWPVNVEFYRHGEAS
jgi:hypothetical protein